MKNLVMVLLLTSLSSFAAPPPRLSVQLAEQRQVLDVQKPHKEQKAAMKASFNLLYSALSSPLSKDPNEELLSEIILLTDAMNQIDTGNAAMDIFLPYYEDHKKQINALLKKMESGPQSEVPTRLRKTIDRFHEGERHRDLPPAATGAASPGHG